MMSNRNGSIETAAIVGQVRSPADHGGRRIVVLRFAYTWATQHSVQPSELGVRITYLATPQRTARSGWSAHRCLRLWR
jgi:hypothetical protein